MYTEGHTVSGELLQSWHACFPDRSLIQIPLMADGAGGVEDEELPLECAEELDVLQAEAEQLEKADLVEWLMEALGRSMRLQLQLDRRDESRGREV